MIDLLSGGMSLEGILLYSFSVGLCQLVRAYHRWTVEKRHRNDDRLLSVSDIQSMVHDMEHLVQKDEGGRGIDQICLPIGELYRSALEVVRFQPSSSDPRHRVAIITGFPCLMDYDPPTETDGPLGAVAIAKALLMLNKTVIIVTDECNEEVVLSAAACMHLEDESLRSHLHMESFPPSTQFDECESRRFEELVRSVGLVIAIERSGPSADGRYLTMRGKDMSHLMAPLDLMLSETDMHASNDEHSESVSKHAVIRSIGIGDGGNEVGMGKVYHQVATSSIPNGEVIACVVPTDHLIVCSVSNWGGYALAASIAAVSLLDPDTLNSSSSSSSSSTTPSPLLRDRINRFLPSDEEEQLKCTRMVEAGARDGVTGVRGLFVDGMPLAESLRILGALRSIAD